MHTMLTHTWGLSNNQLTQLPQLPPSLEVLYCHNNFLTQLDKLPSSLTILWCNNNQIIRLGELPRGLRILSVYNNPMTQLPQLPRSLEHITISPWQIVSCLNNFSKIDLSKIDLKTKIRIRN
jgi:E3 ubiquitin-protein ligase SspH2